MEVNGHCDPQYSSLRDLLQSHLQTDELGASLCVSIDGRTVIDIWGGYADTARTQPWKEDTIAPVWSISKTVTNLAALVLIDRGLLNPYEKVSKYWPEFAQNGKEDIEVRHVLSHTAGLPAWETPITLEELYDIPLATEKLAKQAPWWTSRTVSGYHLVTQGHLVGELVRRISGKTLAQFIRDEFTTPLNADFLLGVPEKDWPRIAEIIPPESMPTSINIDANSIPARAGGKQGTPVPAVASMTPAFRQAEMGASSGFSNARAVNKILSMISLGGEVNGKCFLSPETIELIFREQTNGKDLVLGSHLRFGIGFGLPVPQTVPFIPDDKVCYWGGWGGSIVIMDLNRKMTITYVMNKMGSGTMGTSRTGDFVRKIYQIYNEKA
ncbi:hypothetical protein ASPWEDRAFT_170434 [Aspergillus wentii DTO 134E9]|uniref:Beta-lactamase-related domain-containing protein n=1 Tax=Aspergillus wentii DTO 134E9 TaxID=1073089 RepID=A0A1L9RPR7_ASPWE|nr:uncharacterized protein ASPWEDRAFT_170434 [Aspergillus wentii DTO 134E9]KAI9923930.1 hypothetical protein MW887_008236 [Aspergillus wentii]OJJ36931.1 hypothetical protein ASPWEDRAFT_170434 [Aspergillus wentii DTO 134E9]